MSAHKFRPHNIVNSVLNKAAAQRAGWPMPIARILVFRTTCKENSGFVLGEILVSRGTMRRRIRMIVFLAMGLAMAGCGSGYGGPGSGNINGSWTASLTNAGGSIAYQFSATLIWLDRDPNVSRRHEQCTHSQRDRERRYDLRHLDPGWWRGMPRKRYVHHPTANGWRITFRRITLKAQKARAREDARLETVKPRRC